VESTWAAPETSGLTVHDDGINTGGQSTTVWIADGNFGSFLVTNRIVTAAGRQNDRSLMLIVKQL
jgi:hypothetical protein